MNTPAERAAYIEGLRILAQALEEHPEIPLPYDGTLSEVTFHFFNGEDSRAEMAAAARLLPCPWRKDTRDGHGVSYFDLHGQLAGLKVKLNTFRDAVCTRRVVGVEEQEVEEVVTPAVTRMVTKPVEVVEWDCAPVLGNAIKREPPLPLDVSGDLDAIPPNRIGEPQKAEGCDASCPAEPVMRCTLDAGHDGDHFAAGARSISEPPLTWPAAPAPTCLSCGAADNLAVRRVPARTGIAARDEHYCEDLAACAGRRGGHLTATTGGAP